MELSAEQLKKTFQSIVDITLCAICLETVSRNMIQCVNGHLLCADCRGILKKCPTCQGEFSWRTPTGFIIQLLEALPPRCKYHNCGKYINEEVDHEKFCNFRPTSCRLQGCNWSGPSKCIVPHLGQQHPTQQIYTCCHKVVLKNFDLNKNQTQFDSYMIGNNQYMWQEISYNVDKKALIHYFHFVPAGKPVSNYFIELDASSDDMKCKFVIKLNPDPDCPKEEAPFIYIPKFMLPHFVDESNKELIFQVLVSSRGFLNEDKK